jgi:hypothetical protein
MGSQGIKEGEVLLRALHSSLSMVLKQLVPFIQFSRGEQWFLAVCMELFCNVILNWK